MVKRKEDLLVWAFCLMKGLLDNRNQTHMYICFFFLRGGVRTSKIDLVSNSFPVQELAPMSLNLKIVRSKFTEGDVEEDAVETECQKPLQCFIRSTRK